MKFTWIILTVLVLGIAGCGLGTTTPTKPAATADGYPLNVCIVTGEKLGSMGDPYVFKYEGKTVKFCCSSCIKDFNKDTAKYMAILSEAEKKKSTSVN